jgi:hypothetical protein
MTAISRCSRAAFWYSQWLRRMIIGAIVVGLSLALLIGPVLANESRRDEVREQERLRDDAPIYGSKRNPPLQTPGGRGPLEAGAVRWQSLGAPIPERQTAHQGLRQDRAHTAPT